MRQIVVAISSAIDASALPTIWSVTGSTRALVGHRSLQDERAGRRVAPHRPAGRDDDGGVVLVDEQRARLGRLADGRARPHRHARLAVDLASGAVRAGGVRVELEGAVAATSPSAASRSARISTGEPAWSLTP